MNWLDSLVGFFSPISAVRRVAARNVLAAYEAGEPSRMRQFYRDRSSQNEVVQRGAVNIRTQARHFARNHDLARGALRTIVNNVVGPRGIGIEPQPRRADGSIQSDYAKALLEAWRDWQKAPEVTHSLSWARLQRAAVRAWVRDGEVFAQLILGLRPDLDHGTRVPFSLEVFEADFVPLDYSEPSRRIVQGIERNTWGRPVALHALKSDPSTLSSINYSGNTKRIPWERVLHLAMLDHLGQIRGVSEFASIITRLEDVKDYEESERVAAKIAAMLTAYVKKGTPDLYVPDSGADPREINFAPGMVIDDLGQGEEIGMIDSKRPNPNLITFRQGQLRAVAAGIGASYSSLARDYGGTYSAQRQELVEQWVHYATLADEFVGQFVAPVWETFVSMAHVSGVVRRPSDVQETTADDAIFVATEMPWIDPMKEAQGAQALIGAGLASEIEMIRKRGRNPNDVLEQIATFRKAAEERGLKFSTDASALDPAANGGGDNAPQT